MRLLPFLGIAAAVAVGIALVPYVWWIIGLVLGVTAALLVIGFAMMAWRRVTAYLAHWWHRWMALGVGPDGV